MTRQIRRNAARSDGHTKYDETRGFHYASLPDDASARSAVMAEFDQLNVKAWLMRRIQIALILR